VIKTAETFPCRLFTPQGNATYSRRQGGGGTAAGCSLHVVAGFQRDCQFRLVAYPTPQAEVPRDNPSCADFPRPRRWVDAVHWPCFANARLAFLTNWRKYKAEHYGKHYRVIHWLSTRYAMCAAGNGHCLSALSGAPITLYKSVGPTDQGPALELLPETGFEFHLHLGDQCLETGNSHPIPHCRTRPQHLTTDVLALAVWRLESSGNRPAFLFWPD